MERKKIFLSWSGLRSRAAAEAFRSWLPLMLQSVVPYFTPEDIDKGARWNSEIRAELSLCDFGIIFLTPENQHSPWILFESGALSKLDNSRVAPLLIGMEPADISGPLAQLQLTTTVQADIFKLVRSINSSLGPLALEASNLDELFNALWPRLNSAIENSIAIPTENPKPARRPDRDLLEELVERVRAVEKRVSRKDQMDWYQGNPNNLSKGDILSSSVTDLDIKVRTASVLVQNGIKTVSQLAQLSTHDLMKLPNLGKTGLIDLENALAKHGLEILPF